MRNLPQWKLLRFLFDRFALLGLRALRHASSRMTGNYHYYPLST